MNRSSKGLAAAFTVLACGRPPPESSVAQPVARPVVVGEVPAAPPAIPASSTVALPLPRAGRSLDEALCGADTACRIDSKEPLQLRAAVGQPHLVRTSLTKEAAAARGWGADYPVYWVVVLDDAGRALAAQQLTVGFKAGEAPKSDGIWSTFTLAVHPGSERATLVVSEPSPGGTAWGRSGSVSFAWPGFEPVEWEYVAFHVIDPSLNTSRSWSWDTQSGSSHYTGISFGYVLPRLALDPSFATGDWIGAELDRCSSRLHAKNAKAIRGQRPSPHAISAVLSAENELFLELHLAQGFAPSRLISLEVCYAADVLHSEPEAPGLQPPSCAAWSLDGTTRGAAVRVEKAPDKLRYKVVLPAKDLGELPGVTLVLRDEARRESLLSSAFDFKSHRRLGEVLTFSADRVRCELQEGGVVPRFGALDPHQSLIEQLW